MECIHGDQQGGTGKKSKNLHVLVCAKSLCKFTIQAFENCVVREWNLSYDCLSGVAARAKLRQLKETDPKFWTELTTKQPEDCVPNEDIPQPEDFVDNDTGLLDDSDIPIEIAVNEMISETHVMKKVSRKGYRVIDGGILVADTLAEGFDDERETKPIDVDDGDKQLGRGKRIKRPNQLYSTKTFWMHGGDNDSSDSS